MHVDVEHSDAALPDAVFLLVDVLDRQEDGLPGLLAAHPFWSTEGGHVTDQNRLRFGSGLTTLEGQKKAARHQHTADKAHDSIYNAQTLGCKRPREGRGVCFAPSRSSYLAGSRGCRPA